MQYAPPYILKYLQDKTLDDMQKSQLILATEPENETDREYIYTFSTSVMRHSASHQFLIDTCDAYLPLVSTPECRRFLQSIRIWAYEALEQYEKAIALRLEQAQEADDFESDYKDIAKAYKQIKDYENAIKNYEYYMTLNNDNGDTADYLELAELYELVKDDKNAATWETRFSADHWQMIGRALALDGQVVKAMFYFKIALKIDPKDAYSHYYMGLAYQEKKDRYRALHHYTQALKFKPDFVVVQFNIGLMEWHQEGDIKAAIKCFDKAIDLDTKGAFLLKIYSHLRDIYKEIKEFDKSTYYRRKVFQLLGFPPKLGDYLGSLDEDE